MIKGHTDIDIWNTDFFVNADYFSDDFIIYHNTGKAFTYNKLVRTLFHNNSYKTTYTSFILCLSGFSEIEIDSVKYTIKQNTLLVTVSYTHLDVYKRQLSAIYELKYTTNQYENK